MLDNQAKEEINLGLSSKKDFFLFYCLTIKISW